jgi:hypothetical protein
MDHTKVQGELQAYLDGTLPPEGARAMRAHLDGCADCRAELALLREVDETLRAWPIVPEPEGLAARVMDEVRRVTPEAAPPSLWRTPWPWLRAHWSEVLLGAVLVATLIVLVVSGRALGARDHAGLRFWDLQAQRALSTVERMWYAVRADAGSGQWAGGGALGRASRGTYAAQFYVWVAGAIALVAGLASVGVLAQQWRRLRGTLGPV